MSIAYSEAHDALSSETPVATEHDHFHGDSTTASGATSRTVNAARLFSEQANLLGRPEDFTLAVREIEMPPAPGS